MKKIFCICLVLFLCLAFYACQNESTDSVDPPSDASSDQTNDSLDNSDEGGNVGEPENTEPEFDTVTYDSNRWVYGYVLSIIEPNILEVHLYQVNGQTDEFGEVVHVVTEEDIAQFCVSDDINIRFSKIEKPRDSSLRVKLIANHISFVVGDAKPIIYLYPEEATECSVKVTLNGALTCTYPAHGEDGWQGFTAYPDGTLVFPDGKEYYALYWEGVQNADWDFSEGYCVRGEDTAVFLEWALAAQGLTAREANEFIVYWLPIMQENAYNVISFQTTAYTDGALLDIDPNPDSLLRVFMAFYAAEEEVTIAPQSFEAFEREGFTVVEWGGSFVDVP